MREQRAGLKTRDEPLDVVVVEGGHGSVVEQGLFRLEQVLAPDPEPPPGQLELRMTLRVEGLVDEAVLRLEEQVLQRCFWPDVGENSAHTFPSLTDRRAVVSFRSRCCALREAEWSCDIRPARHEVLQPMARMSQLWRRPPPDGNVKGMNAPVTDEQIRALAATAQPYSLAQLRWGQDRFQDGADAIELEHQRRNGVPARRRRDRDPLSRFIRHRGRGGDHARATGRGSGDHGRRPWCGPG